jgi:hypothetical protein
MSGSMGEGAAAKLPETPAPEDQSAQPGEGAASAASPVSAAQNAATEKELDTPAAGADNASPALAPGDGAQWVEGSLEKLTEIGNAIPVDAPNPVLPLFRSLRDRLIEAGGGIEYAAAPGDTPPATFQAPKKKALPNTVGERTGWKASVISRLKPFLESLPLEAGRPVFDAFETFKKAVQGAKPGEREILD